MSIPLTGTVSLSMIRAHLSNTGTNNFSLKKAGRPTTNGLGGSAAPEYVPVNQNSYMLPNNSAPYAISEWRGYTHSGSGTCSGTSFTSPSIEGAYIYYKVKLTGQESFTSSISVSGSGLSTNYYANFYTSYPFTSTGTITGTPVLSYILGSDTTQIQIFTMSSSADVFFHIVLHRLLI